LQTLVLPTERITDWPSFHAVCARLFGFPAFYGNNMNAWIDCMSDLTEDAGMTAVRLRTGETLTLRVPGYEAFARVCPEVSAALLECTAFVNQRYMNAKQSTRISLVLE
jgi:RNAse (barnase) inhibitor barstar